MSDTLLDPASPAAEAEGDSLPALFVLVLALAAIGVSLAVTIGLLGSLHVS